MSNLEMINNSLAELEQELEKIKTAKELISVVQSSARLTIDEAQKSVQNFKEITERLISESKKSTNETIQEAKELQKNTNELANSVNELMKKLDRVDFPTRLDKIDSSISTTLSAIQNIFQRFDSIERNIKEDLRSHIDSKIKQTTNDINKNIRESRDNFTKEINTLNNNFSSQINNLKELILKKQKINLWILVVIILLNIANLILFKL